MWQNITNNEAKAISERGWSKDLEEDNPEKRTHVTVQAGGNAAHEEESDGRDEDHAEYNRTPYLYRQAIRGKAKIYNKEFDQGNKKMNSDELRCTLSADPIASKDFRGVFSKDQFLSLSRIEKNKRGFYIINTQPSDIRSGHWILFYVKDMQGIYVDSFAEPPEKYGWSSKLRQMCSELVYQTEFIVQNSLSSVCGQHCTYAAFILSRGGILNCIHVRFERTNTVKNDAMVRRFCNKLFPTHKTTKRHDREFLLKQIGVSRMQNTRSENRE